MKEYSIVFPGQGSQTIGMCSEFISSSNICSNVFDKASLILGYDLKDVILNGPKEKLDLTIYTQPALFVLSYALFQHYKKEYDLDPTYMCGHSLGEYTALCCAGAVQFDEMLFVVAKRAEFMQSAVLNGVGAMAAIIGLEDDIVKNVCIDLGNEVVCANYNCPGQIVISGKKEKVLEAIKICKEKGARMGKILPVSIPSHSPLMQEMAEKFAFHIENTSFVVPGVSVISNVDAKVYNSANEIKEKLIKQIYMPVKWQSCVNFMLENDIYNIIECGPGKVLQGLNSRINKKITNMHISNLESFFNL